MLLDRFRERERERDRDRDRERQTQRETEQRYSSGSLLSLHFKCQKHLAPPVFELYYFYS